MANITLKIDDHLLENARNLASQKKTSINAIIRETLERFVSNDQNREASLRGLDAFFLRSQARVGPKTWTRDEIHIPFKVVFRDADIDFLVLFYGILGHCLVIRIRRRRFEPALFIGLQNFLFVVIKLYCIEFTLPVKSSEFCLPLDFMSRPTHLGDQ